MDPTNHKPSPLAALSLYRDLHQAVVQLERTLPPGMALLDSVRAVRSDTWARLKAALGDKLLAASDALKWPLRVDYPSVPAPERRAFERTYTEMLYLQSEGERLGLVPATADWTTGDGLYPIQTLVKPIELRFKYHFQGTRNTNRVDKPEWGFANIQDAVYEHAAFIADYLQPLTAQAGYGKVDVKVGNVAGGLGDITMLNNFLSPSLHCSLSRLSSDSSGSACPISYHILHS